MANPATATVEDGATATIVAVSDPRDSWVTRAWEWVTDKVSRFWGWLKGAVSNVWNWVKGAAVWVRDRVVQAAHWVSDKAHVAWAWVTKAASWTGAAIGKVAVWTWGVIVAMAGLVSNVAVALGIVAFFVWVVDKMTGRKKDTYVEDGDDGEYTGPIVERVFTAEELDRFVAQHLSELNGRQAMLNKSETKPSFGREIFVRCFKANHDAVLYDRQEIHLAEALRNPKPKGVNNTDVKKGFAAERRHWEQKLVDWAVTNAPNTPAPAAA